jgi:hypothetical protein
MIVISLKLEQRICSRSDERFLAFVKNGKIKNIEGMFIIASHELHLLNATGLNIASFYDKMCIFPGLIFNI